MGVSRRAAVAVVFLLAAPVASASTLEPLQVRSASLTQDGQQLVWRVHTEEQFSTEALRRSGRSLCLLIERRHSDSVIGQLCIAPPRRPKAPPRLVFARVTRHGIGYPHTIQATIARSSWRELTGAFLPTAIGLGYRPLRWQVRSTDGSPACAPACEVLFPPRPALARLHVPRLVGCAPSGSPFLYSGPGNRHEIALTFDDGPWPDTPQFLSVLEREHVPATFFQIGEQISSYGESVDRRMLADGDMIGDHTWNHADVSGGGSFAASEISQAAAAIRQATGGFEPCLFRAPGGSVSSALISEARSMGFTTIEWDVDPRDWSRPGTDVIYGNVVANAHNGAIVLQHDGGGDRSETLAALPREIDTLRGEGYQFVTVTDLLGQRLIYK